jgi:hypothetical protein
VLAVAGVLDAREKATIIWALVLLAYVLRKDLSIAYSLLGVLRSAFHPTLSLVWVLAGVYTAGVVCAGRAIGLWHITAIKETCYWFLGTGTVLTFHAMTTRRFGGDYAKRVVRKAVRFTVVVEFLVNLYVLPFVAELFVVPLLALFVIMQIVAEAEASGASAKKVIDGMLTIISLGLVCWVVVTAATNLSELLTREHGESLLLVPAFTVAFVPFLYLMWRCSRWQQERAMRRWREAMITA